MAFVLWMTGLPSSGKTTIIRKLAENIKNLAILDGDELREWLSPKNFSRKGRDEHNRRVAHIAKILLEHNVPVGVSLISPYLENRETAKKIINNNKKFFEVHVKCSLEKCEERDVKGLYKKARNNEIENFTYAFFNRIFFCINKYIWIWWLFIRIINTSKVFDFIISCFFI